MSEKLAPSERHKFVHNEETIYEWDQTLEEVNIYVPLPKGVPVNRFTCEIKPRRVTVGIKGNPPYLDHEVGGEAKSSESFWTVEDGVMHLHLQKMRRGEPWPSAIAGHGTLDPFAADKERQRLMLERFQQEHPGFDFSGAEFNGPAPNPQSFMGGIGHR